jgi:hypothetical protein
VTSGVHVMRGQEIAFRNRETPMSKGVTDVSSQEAKVGGAHRGSAYRRS